MNKEAILDRFFTTCRYSKLYKSIWRQSKLDLSEVIDNLNNHNICDASNGFASGFIYYRDTIPFGKKHFTDAVKLNNHYGFNIDFFDSEGEIDYNKVSFFLIECFLIDFVNYLTFLR